MTNRFAVSAIVAAASVLAPASPVSAASESSASALVGSVSYADLADLADGAELVVRAQIRKLVPLKPANTPGPANITRFYVEARTEALYFGRRAVGETLRYLVDLPVDAKGRPAKVKKQSFVLFAHSAPGRVDQLQLVRPDAQLPWSAGDEQRIKRILAELHAVGAPQRVTGVREALHVPGALAGEGETQFFLTTADDQPAAVSVLRRPGSPAQISVSFSDLVEQGAGMPRADSLGWYRLACFLPSELPVEANIATEPTDRAAAQSDYRAVIEQLGPCPRQRK